MVELVMTAWLSPNNQAGPFSGTRREQKGDLVCGSSAGSHKLTSIGYSFNVILSLAKPIYWGLGNHM